MKPYAGFRYRAFQMNFVFETTLVVLIASLGYLVFRARIAAIASERLSRASWNVHSEASKLIDEVTAFESKTTRA